MGAHEYFFAKQTQQVVENTGKVSGIGQNNPNFGHLHSQRVLMSVFARQVS
jgi:hypothetical protein